VGTNQDRQSQNRLSKGSEPAGAALAGGVERTGCARLEETVAAGRASTEEADGAAAASTALVLAVTTAGTSCEAEGDGVCAEGTGGRMSGAGRTR